MQCAASAHVPAPTWLLFCGGTGMHAFIEALLDSNSCWSNVRDAVSDGVQGVASGGEAASAFPSFVPSRSVSGAPAAAGEGPGGTTFPRKVVCVLPVTDDGGSSRPITDLVGGPAVGDARNMQVSAATAVWRWRQQCRNGGLPRTEPPIPNNVPSSTLRAALSSGEDALRGPRIPNTAASSSASRSSAAEHAVVCAGFVSFLQHVLRHRLAGHATEDAAVQEVTAIASKLLTASMGTKTELDAALQTDTGAHEQEGGGGGGGHLQHPVDDRSMEWLQRCKRRAGQCLLDFLALVAQFKSTSDLLSPKVPRSFDWRGASVGNLILAALLASSAAAQTARPMTTAMDAFWRTVCGMLPPAAAAAPPQHRRSSLDGSTGHSSAPSVSSFVLLPLEFVFLPCIELVRASAAATGVDVAFSPPGLGETVCDDAEPHSPDAVAAAGDSSALAADDGSTCVALKAGLLPLPRIALEVTLADGTAFSSQTAFSYGPRRGAAAAQQSESEQSDPAGAQVAVSPEKAEGSFHAVHKDAAWRPLPACPVRVTCVPLLVPSAAGSDPPQWIYAVNEAALNDSLGLSGDLAAPAASRGADEGQPHLWHGGSLLVVFGRGSFVTSMGASCVPLAGWLHRLQARGWQPSGRPPPIGSVAGDSGKRTDMYRDFGLHTMLLMNGSVDRETSAFVGPSLMIPAMHAPPCMASSSLTAPLPQPTALSMAVYALCQHLLRGQVRLDSVVVLEGSCFDTRYGGGESREGALDSIGGEEADVRVHRVPCAAEAAWKYDDAQLVNILRRVRCHMQKKDEEDGQGCLV